MYMENMRNKSDLFDLEEFFYNWGAFFTGIIITIIIYFIYTKINFETIKDKIKPYLKD